MSRLDPKEESAIQLALEIGIDTIMDEISGRQEASRRHPRVTGTVAILEKAAQRAFIQFRDALQRLEATNFRLSPAIRDQFLNRNP